jgi:hypothetical protein
MVKKVNKSQQIREYLEAKPEATTAEIAKKCKAEPAYIYVIKNKMKHTAIEKSINKTMDSINAINKTNEPKPDSVNHPLHYKAGGIETIDFIEAKELGYHLGNVIKYVSRAKHKGNQLEDLKKAQWYLNREIDKLTGETK